MSNPSDDTMVMLSRSELLRLLVKAAQIGSDSTAYSGQLDTYDFLHIGQEVLDSVEIPAVVNLT